MGSSSFARGDATGYVYDSRGRVELRAGTTGVAGLPKLNSSTAKNDSFSDTLTGGSGMDWFFAKLNSPARDTVLGLISGDQEN
jgi:hypothetical protein